MLNPKNFEGMTLTERVEMLRIRGEFISHIKENEEFVDLYECDKQLFEVFHNPALWKIKMIERIDNKSKRLELYAEQVDITDALKN